MERIENHACSLNTNNYSLPIYFCYCHIRTSFCAHSATYTFTFRVIEFNHVISKAIGFAAFFNKSFRASCCANVTRLATTVIYNGINIKDDAVKTKGYFIYPSQLFVNVAKNANENQNLNTDLAKIFAEIEGSAKGYDSEQDIKGLFAD